jgi:hypothetical protein
VIQINGQGISVQPDLLSIHHVLVDGRLLRRMIGGEAVAGAPPAAANGNGQGAGAQQPPQPGAQQDGFRQMFAGIDDNTWTQVEPSLRQVQGHITRLEQASSVAKPFIEAGVTPEQSQQILTFVQNYNNDPVGTFLNMAAQLQAAGVIHEDVDLEDLEAAVYGEPSAEEGQPYNGQPELQSDASMGLPPEVQQRMDQLQEAVEVLLDEREQNQTQQETRRQDALRERAMTSVREQLTQAKVPVPSDDMLLAAIIANRGDIQRATKSIVDYSGSTLENLRQSRQEGTDPQMPRGAPPTRQRQTRQPRDAFEAARPGAEQALRRANEQAAQGG